VENEVIAVTIVGRQWVMEWRLLCYSHDYSHSPLVCHSIFLFSYCGNSESLPLSLHPHKFRPWTAQVEQWLVLAGQSVTTRSWITSTMTIV